MISPTGKDDRADQGLACGECAIEREARRHPQNRARQNPADQEITSRESKFPGARFHHRFRHVGGLNVVHLSLLAVDTAAGDQRGPPAPDVWVAPKHNTQHAAAR